MCYMETPKREGETRQERRQRLICAVYNGQGKVQRHQERLRTENPRLHAALLPLLADLDSWMKSVSDVVEIISEDARRAVAVATEA